jgi:hypothetical protein
MDFRLTRKGFIENTVGVRARLLFLAVCSVFDTAGHYVGRAALLPSILSGALGVESGWRAHSAGH